MRQKQTFIPALILLMLFSNILIKANTRSNSQNIAQDSLVVVPNRSHTVYDIVAIRNIDSLKLYGSVFKYHPALSTLLTNKVRDSIQIEIDKRVLALDSDTLHNKELFYVYRPMFDWANNIDPHFRIVPSVKAPIYKDALQIHKYIVHKQKRLPVTLCNINDSLIVYKSLDSSFKRGDLVKSMNGVSAKEYLKYYYKDRFVNPFNLMLIYDFMAITPEFRVEIIRDNKPVVVTTSGFSPSQLIEKDTYNVQVFEGYNCGYICIKEFFPNNSYLIKRVRGAIEEFKRAGVTNVVIDVRENVGGYGHRLDDLLSIFSNKESISLTKSQQLRVSECTVKDYDFVDEKMMFQNVEFPKDGFVQTLALKPELQITGMKYYILASKYTASTAAGFVNILHYNNFATYCGEPLTKNALKYGDTLDGDLNGVFEGTLLMPIGVSSIEYDEHTKAIDGVLYPDIHIPYVANEYMTGKDAVLERLLEIVKN